MKRVLLALLIVAVAVTGIIAKSRDKKAKTGAKVEASDETVITALKFFLSKQNDCAYMVRAYEYTVTTEKNNPHSFVVCDTSGESAKEAGLTKKDKGKFAAAFADRDGARVSRLWDGFGDDLLALFPKAQYDEMLKWSVDHAVNYRESPRYAADLAKLVKECPMPGKEVQEKVYGIGGDNYSQLGFWYRRTMEKNDEVTYKILKEIQEYYK